MMDWFWIFLFQMTSLAFGWLWYLQSKLTGKYRTKFEDADERARENYESAQLLAKKFELLEQDHKMLLGEYDALEKDFEIKEESAKLRLDSIEQYIVDLMNANGEIAKLKAENAALKDWQPIKDKIEKMMSIWASPIDTQIVKFDKCSPVTCVSFPAKYGETIVATHEIDKPEDHELDYKYEDR